jgi:hypothetical protein
MKYLLLSFFLSFNIQAKPAPKNMKEFNKTCPTPKLCNELYSEKEACEKKDSGACDRFVNVLRKALPEYDCQRDFDKSNGQKYIVPAIWLCDGHDSYLDALSKLKTKNAKKLYGSKLFRNALDGASAEEHLENSKKVEKTLKR